MNTHRQIDIHTGTLKHQIYTAQHHKGVCCFFLVASVVRVVLSSSTLRGSTLAVPVFWLFARLMEYTNLTTEKLRDTVFSSPQWELL